MASEWYYSPDGRSKIGPVSPKVLKQLAEAGRILPTDFVFKIGTTKWVKAGQVAGLFDGTSVASSTQAIELDHTAVQTQRTPSDPKPSSVDAAASLPPLPRHQKSPRTAPGVTVVTISSDDTSLISPRRRTTNWWNDPILRVAIVVPAIVLAFFFGYVAWEWNMKQFHLHVIQLKQEGDRFESTGRKKDAYLKFKELCEYVGSSEPKDSAAKNAVTAARRERDRLFPLVKEEFEREQVEREARVAAAEEERKRMTEESRLAGIAASLSGGCWLTKRNGESMPLRGLTVYVVKAKVNRDELATTISRKKREFTDECHMYEGYAVNAEQKQPDNELDPLDPRQPRVSAASFRAYAVEYQKKADELSKILSDDAKLERLGNTLSIYQFLLDLTYRNYNRHAKNEPWFDFVKRNRVDQATSGIDGRYRLSNLKGGEYCIYAIYKSDESLAEWLVPVVLDKPGEISLDLFNDNASVIVNRSD